MCYGLQLKNSLFHKLVLFGTIYIPPESSSYSNISIFESNENDIVSLNPKNNHKICLIDDFNAHTSNAEDVIYVNEVICTEALEGRFDLLLITYYLLLITYH